MKANVKSKTTTTTKARTSNGKVSPEDIAFAAYCIWDQEGRLDGHDLDHWFRAENLLRHAQAEVQSSPASQS